MKHSPKRPAPPGLTEWLGLSNEDWTPDWENFAGTPKSNTHNSLLEEQGYVCAYCGTGLKGENGDSHIDHFWPQAHFPDRILDYANLFASCGPSSQKKAPKTCGDAKGDWFDQENIDHIPSQPGCEHRFRYDARGWMHPADALASSVITQLNLNDPSLREERRRIVKGIEDAITAGEITPADVAQEIASWRAPDAAGRAKSFGHVAARYLEDEPI